MAPLEAIPGTAEPELRAVHKLCRLKICNFWPPLSLAPLFRLSLLSKVYVVNRLRGFPTFVTSFNPILRILFFLFVFDSKVSHCEICIYKLTKKCCYKSKVCRRMWHFEVVTQAIPWGMKKGSLENFMH